jgi:hypothetical protein
MNYTDLNLKLNTTTRVISVADQDIHILQYLPIEEKNDIIQLALQNSEENGIYNLLKLEMFFKLYIVFLYSDINFSQEEKNNMTLVFDTLESNGIINLVLSEIDDNEMRYLRETLTKTLEMKLKYRSTIASVITGFIENLPINAETAKNTLENFDPNQFKMIINMAKELGLNNNMLYQGQK